MNDGVIRYVRGDIGNINVDEIVGKLGYIEGMYYVIFILSQLFGWNVFRILLLKWFSV